jgi:RimJ/RimL family protein N-acetyltransferase
LDWAFADGGYELIMAEALIQNERSWRGLERRQFAFRRTPAFNRDVSKAIDLAFCGR